MREDLFDEKVWFPPEHLPDLSGEKIVAVDVETKDPNLRDLGPGWIRKDGNLIGVSVAASGWSAYLPIAHEGGGNMAKDLVLRWLQEGRQPAWGRCQGGNVEAACGKSCSLR